MSIWSWTVFYSISRVAEEEREDIFSAKINPQQQKQDIH